MDGDILVVLSDAEITLLIGSGLGATLPQPLGLAASAGAATEATRVDHIHTHGDLTAASGTMHALSQLVTLPKQAYYEGIPTPLSPHFLGNDEISNPGNTGPDGERAFGAGAYASVEFSIRTAHTAGPGIELLIVNLTTAASTLTAVIPAFAIGGPASGTVALVDALPVADGDLLIATFLTPLNKADLGVGLPALISGAAVTAGIPAAAVSTNGSGWRISLF